MGSLDSFFVNKFDDALFSSDGLYLTFGFLHPATKTRHVQ
jgi:hypothetical protein